MQAPGGNGRNGAASVSVLRRSRREPLDRFRESILCPVKSVILIGMPGSGKSTVGVLLAKRLRRGFVDTDLILQEKDGRALQEILDTEGAEGFIATEERILTEFVPTGEVVATGGSVVYSQSLMEHFSRHGILVFLDVHAEVLLPRLSNLDTRGVVRRGGQTVQDLWNERDPLYRKWAQVCVDNSMDNHESVIEAIASLPELHSPED